MIRLLLFFLLNPVLLAQSKLVKKANELMDSYGESKLDNTKKSEEIIHSKRKRLITTLEKGSKSIKQHGNQEATDSLSAIIAQLRSEHLQSAQQLSQMESTANIKKSIRFYQPYYYQHPSEDFKKQYGTVTINAQKAELKLYLNGNLQWKSSSSWELKQDHILIKTKKNNIILRPTNRPEKIKMIWYGQYNTKINAYLSSSRVQTHENQKF